MHNSPPSETARVCWKNEIILIRAVIKYTNQKYVCWIMAYSHRWHLRLIWSIFLCKWMPFDSVPTYEWDRKSTPLASNRMWHTIGVLDKMAAHFPPKLLINWYYYSLIFSFTEGNVVKRISSMICRKESSTSAKTDFLKLLFFTLNEGK